jgi:hypothetical protein
MPLKIILLYDAANRPLKVRGLHVELLAQDGELLDSGMSEDLNPGPDGSASNEWGVELDFPASSRPLDIYLTDPFYRYPGNTVRYLNGRVQDRIYIDVMQLPPTSSNLMDPPASVHPRDLADWVYNSPNWDDDQKDAVYNLLFNYISVVAGRAERMQASEELLRVADNWGEALKKLGFPVEMLLKSPSSSSKSNPPAANVNWKIAEEPAQYGYETEV